jgi:hypothetical protein
MDRLGDMRRCGVDLAGVSAVVGELSLSLSLIVDS